MKRKSKAPTENESLELTPEIPIDMPAESPDFGSTINIQMVSPIIIDQTEPPPSVSDWVDFNRIEDEQEEPDDLPDAYRDRYFTHIQPRLEEILMWRSQGLTITEIAKNLMVSYTCLNENSKRHPALFKYLQFGKGISRAQKVNALHMKSVGYTIVLPQQKVLANGEVVNYKQTIYIPPDVAAIKLALENEYPEKYSSKLEVNHQGTLTLAAVMADVAANEQARRAEELVPPE